MTDDVDITPAPLPTAPTRDPERTIRAHANTARRQLLALAVDRDRWAELVDLAVERATSIGAYEYGTRTWERTPPEVAHEADCEIADWLFYVGVQEDLAAEAGAASA